MKTIRRILSIFVVLLMVFAMSETAYADNDFLDSARLNNWLDTYIGDNGLSGNNQALSVGFIYTKTGDEFYYNADVFMYSASLYKVPVSMMLSEEEAAGKLTQQSYVKGMTVEYLEYTALVNSNNDSGHYIADYIGESVSQYDTYSGKDADMAKKYAPGIEDSYYNDDFYNLSYYTARFMTQVMNTLYKGGDAQYPGIIGYLKQAQPFNYYNLSLAGKYDVAQKYGAFEERNGTKDNHCAAIIYTPNPVIVVVMTKNIEPYEKTIADIGEYLAEYAVELDSKPVPTPTPEPTQAPVQTPSPTIIPIATTAPTPNPADNNGKTFPVYIFLIIPVLIAVIIILKKVRFRDDNDDFDYEEETVARPGPTADDENKSKGKYTPKH